MSYVLFRKSNLSRLAGLTHTQADTKRHGLKAFFCFRRRVLKTSKQQGRSDSTNRRRKDLRKFPEDFISWLVDRGLCGEINGS